VVDLNRVVQESLSLLRGTVCRDHCDPTRRDEAELAGVRRPDQVIKWS
jgi:hypothetical protein